MSVLTQSIIDTRRHQMFPTLEPVEIERVRQRITVCGLRNFSASNTPGATRQSPANTRRSNIAERQPLRGLRRSTLSWCRRTTISASNAAHDLNSPIKAHQINPQRSLIGSEYQPIRNRSQRFWVCGRDSGLSMVVRGNDLDTFADISTEIEGSPRARVRVGRARGYVGAGELPEQ
jgi:hypothetical protein